MKDEHGNVLEDVDGMLRRVATYIGYDDEQARMFYNIMYNQEFLPNSPTLMNAGHPASGCLSACFVVPIEDTMESILDGVKHAALICKAGGGVGYSFSKLRPKNDAVQSTHGVSSGPLSFMQIYNTMTDTIKQGGRRRGANMGILHISHPDILEFINAKRDRKQLNNFNLSVSVTDEFMIAVKEGSSYPLINPRTNEQVEMIKARDVWQALVQNAWESGEPGVMFIDTINKANPTPSLGNIEATNPCGEQPLLPYESCNLGSINLAKFVVNNSVDWDGLEHTINTSVRFLDNVIDKNHYPLPEIEIATKRTRKIGLGVMGWADMLIALGIPYNSVKALNLAEKVMKFINDRATEASSALALELGGAPCYEDTMYRNMTRTTIAPTGTISVLANCSSGIEPLYRLAYQRTIMDDDKFIEMHPQLETLVKSKLTERQFNRFKDDLLEQGKLSEDLLHKYKLEDIDYRVWITSHDIPAQWHIRMQAAFQKHVDNAVSKTINLPNEADVRDISKAFEMAWGMGIKGVTVYRDGARLGQVLSAVTPVEVKARPDELTGGTTMVRTGCGSLYITQNYDKDGLFEVFLQLGKAGGCETALTETTGRLISLARRAGVSVEDIIKQLTGIRCPKPCWDKGVQMHSCFDAVAKKLADKAQIAVAEQVIKDEACPDCSQTMELKSGCMHCPYCGYEKCQ